MAKEEDQKYIDEDVYKKDEGKTDEAIQTEMETGEKDEDPYTEEGREKLEEDDEISPAESAFMEGVDEEGKSSEAKCAKCGKILGDKEEGVVEKEIDGRVRFFCSEECAEEFEENET